jgi:serine/threonine protein kinase
MLDRQGYLRLVDMGFAKLLRPGQRTYTYCGTLHYMSPEVLLGKVRGFVHLRKVFWSVLQINTCSMYVTQPGLLHYAVFPK